MVNFLPRNQSQSETDEFQGHPHIQVTVETLSIIFVFGTFFHKDEWEWDEVEVQLFNPNIEMWTMASEDI